jgi:CDP-diacylglycerol--glycerol-3-phosphate 3-phosphatidyltransferase
MAKRIFNLANNLTLTRIVVVPILIVLFLYSTSKTSCLIAALLFTNLITSFGQFLDPLADKILVSITLIMLVSLNRVPAWMVAIIIAREVAITGLRIAAAREGIIITSSKWAKYKTAFQLVATGELLIHYTYFGINFHLVGIITLTLAMLITLWTGLVYFINLFKYTASFSKE